MNSTKMFLLIFEDGSMKQKRQEELTPEDYRSIRDGYLQAVRFDDGNFEEVDRNTCDWVVVEHVE